MLERELKKGSTELLILAILEDGQSHGYEIAKEVERRSEGALRVYVASLYPKLYRMEERGWITGRWVEKPGQRRCRFYRLTSKGEKVLKAQRAQWRDFVRALDSVTGFSHA